MRAGRLEHRLAQLLGLWGEVFSTSSLAVQWGTVCRVKPLLALRAPPFQKGMRVVVGAIVETGRKKQSREGPGRRGAGAGL